MQHQRFNLVGVLLLSLDGKCLFPEWTQLIQRINENDLMDHGYLILTHWAYNFFFLCLLSPGPLKLKGSTAREGYGYDIISLSEETS